MAHRRLRLLRRQRRLDRAGRARAAGRDGRAGPGGDRDRQGRRRRQARAARAVRAQPPRRSVRPAAAAGAAHPAQAVPPRLRGAPRPALPRGPAPARGPRVRDRRLLRGRAHLGAGRPPVYHWVRREERQRLLRPVRCRRLLRQRPRGARPGRGQHRARPVPRRRCWPTGTAARCSAGSAGATGCRRDAEWRARAVRGDPQARARALRRGRPRAAAVQPADALARCCAPATTSCWSAFARFENRLTLDAAHPRDRAAAARISCCGSSRGWAASAPGCAWSATATGRSGSPPTDDLAEAIPQEVRDATGGCCAAPASTSTCATSRDGTEYMLPARTRVRAGRRAPRPSACGPRLQTSVPIAPTAAAAGGPLPPGTWEVRADGQRSPASRTSAPVPRARRAARWSPPTRPGGSWSAARRRRRPPLP